MPRPPPFDLLVIFLLHPPPPCVSVCSPSPPFFFFFLLGSTTSSDAYSSASASSLYLRLFFIFIISFFLETQFSKQKQKKIQTFINSFRQGDNPNLALHIITTRQIQRNPFKKNRKLWWRIIKSRTKSLAISPSSLWNQGFRFLQTYMVWSRRLIQVFRFRRAIEKKKEEMQCREREERRREIWETRNEKRRKKKKTKIILNVFNLSVG